MKQFSRLAEKEAQNVRASKRFLPITLLVHEPVSSCVFHYDGPSFNDFVTK